MINKNINTALKHLVYDDYLQAENILKKIIADSPYEFKAFYYLGWIYEKINKKELAMDYFSHAYFLNNTFFDIDEKIHGYAAVYVNDNVNIVNVIQWMIKTGRQKDIGFIIARANNQIAQKLLEEKKSIKQARNELYNNEIRSLVKPYVDATTMLIFDVGFNLNLWGMIHPWNFPIAFSYLKTISKAILTPKVFESELVKKDNYNFIEIEIIKKKQITNAVPVLINSLNNNHENIENVIEALGHLKDYDAIFPLLNYLRSCNIENVYSTVLALARIGEENISPVVQKYVKKYLNTELKPLLFVTLCRLREGKEGLLRLCDCTNINIREEAVNQISDYKGRDVVKTLLKSLYDETRIEDFYPIRNTAFIKLEEMDINYLKSIDRNFALQGQFKKIENEIFLKDKPKIDWVDKIIEKL